jgi:glycosyltransferase involved in cell wall biosynthesis
MSAPPYPSISVVVPVYNSEQMLGTLVDRLLAALTALTPRLEILLVNDGSRDGSWPAIEKLAAKFPQVRGIDLMRNFGQHNALLAGIRAASGDLIVTLDDDLQNPPEEIPKILARLEEGVDVVYGCP